MRYLQLDATDVMPCTTSVGRFAVSNAVPVGLDVVAPGVGVATGAWYGVASGLRPANGAEVAAAVDVPVTRT